MPVLDLIAAERRRVADLLGTLDEDQWNAPSLCGAWTVREVAAHLTAGWNVSRLEFARLLVRHRGFDGANAAYAKTLGERPTDAIVDDLRRNADDPFRPPLVGIVAQLADIITHGQDIAIPLGIEHPVEADRVRPALGLAIGRTARLVSPTTHRSGIRFETEDQAWGWGSGPVARGSSVHVLIALLGRAAGADRLSGPGAELLRDRMA